MTAPLLFNPSRATTEELESTFVGRHSVLDRLETALVKDQESKTPRHWQLVGPRGAGKSHLSELLVRRMRTRHHWRVARLPEESYQVSGLGELLEQIVIRSEGLHRSPFLDVADESKLQDLALDRLATRRRTEPQPLIVVLENLGAFFARHLKSSRDQGRLRDILSNNPPFVLFGTSTSQPDATLKYTAPLHDFFHTVVLDDLTPADITELVRARATWENNDALLAHFDGVRGRIEAIYHLSGGNPRLALALYRVVQDGVTEELHAQLMKLLDEVTPYYQSRLSDIPPQAARVLTEMALMDTVSTPASIAKRCRMPTNQATAQIRKLVDERLIVAGGRPDARSRFYEFRDRLMRIWIQMRETGGASRRLRFLAEFYDRWYAGRLDELEAVSRRAVSDLWTEVETGDYRKCGDRLKTISYLADVGAGFDGSAILRGMSLHVQSASPADVRAHVDKLALLFAKAADLREREALAYLLRQCFLTLNAESESLAFLRQVLDEGSTSEAIAGGFADALVSARAYDEAFDFTSRWMLNHPSHLAVQDARAVAAFNLAKFEQGFEALAVYLSVELCEHCQEQVLRQSVDALWAQPNRQLRKRLIQDFVLHGEATAEQVEAIGSVLATDEVRKIKSSHYVRALNAWPQFEAAPPWMLWKSMCGLGHRRGQARHVLRIAKAFASFSDGRLGQFVVDHLVEALPELQRRRDRSVEGGVEYASAIDLVRHRTAPGSVAAAFAYCAPALAKRLPTSVDSLLQLYRQWREEGLLGEPISPYAEALDVIASADREKALAELHPEMREAVTLLVPR